MCNGRCSILFVLPVIAGLSSNATSAEPADDLIRQAGNAEDDAQRLEILNRLAKLQGLDPQLRGEVDRMVALVDRWLHDPSLYRWFDRDIRRNLDYDFHVRPESPLYPLARLYRGRMLVWAANEYGNILGYHEGSESRLERKTPWLACQFLLRCRHSHFSSSDCCKAFRRRQP